MRQTLLNRLAAIAMPITSTLASILSIGKQATHTKAEHPQTLVGGGYYALRPNTSAGDKHYTKLVKADSSNLHKPKLTKFIPSIGSRNDRPDTRRSRRNVPMAA